ncbi:hypothetical protein ULF88_22180 [Halopseudomonas pachastrellae]|nr:hypothetical protein [Halopseudomonas pachastrellae]
MRHDWFMVRGFNPGRFMDGLRLPFGVLGYAQLVSTLFCLSG